MPGEPYLAWPLPFIRQFWRKRVQSAAFIPYAGVTISWNEYVARVRGAFASMDIAVHAVHETSDPSALLQEADAVIIGGGNTFCLLAELQSSGLLTVIRSACLAGKPYLGWSAGANVACPTIRTTNDMPVRQPQSFDSLGLVPFQINPHYHNERIPGQGGETRNERLLEYCAVNPDIPVVGLPEGCFVHAHDNCITFMGSRSGALFEGGMNVSSVEVRADLSFLLTR